MKIIRCIGVDPGNGFIKMCAGNKCVKERMLFTKVNAMKDVVKFNSLLNYNGENFVYGNEAYSFTDKYKSFVNENSLDRYDDRFITFLMAFIYKSYCNRERKVNIKQLTLGVPNVLVASNIKKIRDMLTNKFNINMNHTDRIAVINKEYQIYY